MIEACWPCITGNKVRGWFRFSLSQQDLYPCLADKTEGTPFDAHYVYHTSWAARILDKTRPNLHVDFSSSIYFASIASAFVPIQFYDYRPVRLQLPNLECREGDLLNLPLPSGSLASISCMHVVEHVGLGRYGDPLDYDGDLKAIVELQRVLEPGGQLLFVVPVGAPKIQFNAHRIYSLEQVTGLFQKFSLQGKALVTDQGDFIENAPQELFGRQKYGCGCFWFIKN